MGRLNNSNNEKQKIRYNIVSLLVYAIGIILFIQLFNLQIVHGEEYREESNTRLTRESTLEAARGDILDQSGNKLATTKLGYSLELYKTKIDTQTLNETLLRIAKLLEANNNAYVDTLPITVEPFAFTTQEKAQIDWKKENDIEENKTAEECFAILKEKYKITNENVQEARKIMTLRYYISKNGYSSTRSVELASNLNETSIAQLNEQSANFPGVSVITKPIRSYPSGSLASHILGYIGKINEEELNQNKERYTMNDIIGRTGIEYIMENYLKGENGKRQIDMAVDGTVTDEYVAEQAISGCNIILTIDANLQQVTENTLKSSIQSIEQEKQVEITGASAVVMKVETGEILAMASYPDFDPSDFANGISTEKWNYYTKQEESAYAKKQPFFNRAIASTTSPGSTFKMVTAITGLETGAITLNEKINDVGIYRRYADYQPKCWTYAYGYGHGPLNVTEAIVHSCNYFFYEVGYRVGIDNLEKYAKALGLGKKTGVELLGEETGYIATPETAKKFGQTWNGGDTLPAAIGQGNNSFTPIQMAKYTSILANGGKNIDVSIIKSVIDANGNEVPKQEVEQYLKNRIGIEKEPEQEVTFKQENLNAVLEGMKGVTTESGGTAYSIFKNFNIEVGGKTGSAQTERKDQNGKDITNAWFVGFAPFEKPEIAIVVMIENGQSGSNAAIPARDMIAEYFGMNASKVTEDMSAKPTTQIQN